MDRVKKIFGLGIPAAVVCALGYLAARLRLSMPRTEGQLNLRGLSGEVEVIYDKAGIPTSLPKARQTGSAPWASSWPRTAWCRCS